MLGKRHCGCNLPVTPYAYADPHKKHRLNMKDKQQFTIESETHYQGIRSILSKESQKPGILRLLMRAMEAYRSARKYGWSRPWNKYGVMNFQSLRIWPQSDSVIVDQAQNILNLECTGMPYETQQAVHTLLNDRQHLMGFLFAQETIDEEGDRFEGINISLGRVNAKRYRDRIDIIIESKIIDNVSSGPSQIRVYVDPYDKDRKAPLWTFKSDIIKSEETNKLFENLAAVSWEWAQNKSRQWDHWTSNYIDYFGPRQWDLQSSYLFNTQDPKTRIATTLPDWALEKETKKAC